MKKLSKTTQKKTSTKSKMSKYQSGGLIGNQKKLDINNNNRLDRSDFRMLRTRKK